MEIQPDEHSEQLADLHGTEYKVIYTIHALGLSELSEKQMSSVKAYVYKLAKEMTDATSLEEIANNYEKALSLAIQCKVAFTYED